MINSKTISVVPFLILTFIFCILGFCIHSETAMRDTNVININCKKGLSDSIEFSNYINNFVEYSLNKDSVRLSLLLSDKICINHPDVLTNVNDTVIHNKSGEYTRQKITKFLIQGIDSIRKVRLLKKTNWTFQKNRVEIYDSFNCSYCPDEVFSYYWVFIKTNQKYKLVKISNNDFENACN